MCSFSPLQAVSGDGAYKSVAVPSRLYSRVSQRKPLARSRITIKDNFALEGVKLTMMNRAYTELCEPKKESATVVQKLIDLVAVIVGTHSPPPRSQQINGLTTIVLGTLVVIHINHLLGARPARLHLWPATIGLIFGWHR